PGVLEEPRAGRTCYGEPAAGAGAASCGGGRTAGGAGGADGGGRAGPRVAGTGLGTGLRPGGLHRRGAGRGRRRAVMADRSDNDGRSFMQRWLPHPLLTVVLIALWMLLLNNFSAGGLLMGSLLGVVIPIITSNFWPERPPV